MANANEQSTALDLKGKIDKFGGLLELNKETFGAVLPAHMKLERFMKTAITLIAQKPDLLKCTRGSILNSLLMCAELGLDPSNGLGLAYIVPFSNTPKNADGSYGTKRLEAQLVPGFRGLILLAKRSGEVIKIDAETVFEGDRFDVELGLNEKLIHVPNFDVDRSDDSKAFAVYAVATLRDGTKQFVVMSRKQVEAIRLRAPSKNSPAWSNNYGEMMKKTVVRRIAKLLSLSPDTDFSKALQHEANADEDKAPAQYGNVFKASFFEDGGEVIDVLPAPSGAGSTGIADNVRKGTATARANASAATGKASASKPAPTGTAAPSGNTAPADVKAELIKRAFAFGCQKSDLLKTFGYSPEDWDQLSNEEAAGVAEWLTRSEAANKGEAPTE